MDICRDSECCDGTDSRRDDEAMLGCLIPAPADGNCMSHKPSMQVFFFRNSRIQRGVNLFELS